MRPEVYCSLTGLGGAADRFATLGDALPALVAEGFTGVAAATSLAESVPDFRSQLGERGLDYLATGELPDAALAERLAALAGRAEEAAFHRPQLLVVRSGLPALDPADMAELARAATDLTEETGFLIAHEIRLPDLVHRAEALAALAQQHPDLPLAVDATGTAQSPSGEQTSAVRRLAAAIAVLTVTPGQAALCAAARARPGGGPVVVVPDAAGSGAAAAVRAACG